MPDAKKGLDRLVSILENECEGRDVSVKVTVTPKRKEISLGVNGDTEFIPNVATHVADTGISYDGYQTVDQLAEALIDDLAGAAILAHTEEPEAKPQRRRR